MPPPEAKPEASAPKEQPKYSSVVSDHALDLLLGAKRADDPTRSAKVCKDVQPILLTEDQVRKLGIREMTRGESQRLSFPNGIEKAPDRILPDGLEAMPKGAKVVATTDNTTIVTDRKGNPLAIHSEDMKVADYVFVNGKTIIETKTGKFYLDKNNCQSEAALREANHLPTVDIAFDSSAMQASKPAKGKDSPSDKPLTPNDLKPEVKRYLRQKVGLEIFNKEMQECVKSGDPLCGLPDADGISF